jgi:hypothetical protein
VVVVMDGAGIGATVLDTAVRSARTSDRLARCAKLRSAVGSTPITATLVDADRTVAGRASDSSGTTAKLPHRPKMTPRRLRRWETW